ncbi:hypothetical protein LDENG_00120750 [Lucifuga dentata]|nr:hypothetical protein LDENG_00120750 [Lucifuga dentata]
MHLTRPKSSKGRRRPTVEHSVYAGDDTDSIQKPPGTPKSPAYNRQDSQLHMRSQSALRQTSQHSQDEVVQMLQLVPAAPPLSLNKYKVLPSIERRPSEVNPSEGLDKKMPKSNLSDDALFQQQQRHREPDPPTVMTQAVTHSNPDLNLNVQLMPPDPGSIMAREVKECCSSAGAGSLLLAIRAPCGRRFQQYFKPTDALLIVRASAEAKYRSKYGKVSIETMDVPRRTFTDMDMTLAQCGILNRSVLCISQNDSLVEQE